MFNKQYKIYGITKQGAKCKGTYMAKSGSHAHELFYKAFPGSKIKGMNKRKTEWLFLCFKWMLVVIAGLLLIAGFLWILVNNIRNENTGNDAF